MSDVILVVNTDYDPEKYVFSSEAALKKWMKKNGLVFDSWDYQGKMMTSKYTLKHEDGGEYEVTYGLPVLTTQRL